MNKALRNVLNFLLAIIIPCLSIFALALPIVVTDSYFFEEDYPGIAPIIATVIVLILCYILRVRYDIKYRYYACSSLSCFTLSYIFYNLNHKISEELRTVSWEHYWAYHNPVYEFIYITALSFACVLFAFFLIGLLIDTIAIHIRKVKKVKNVSDSK